MNFWSYPSKSSVWTKIIWAVEFNLPQKKKSSGWGLIDGKFLIAEVILTMQGPGALLDKGNWPNSVGTGKEGEGGTQLVHFTLKYQYLNRRI